ncbi:MAG: hypothetical protein ACOC5R_00975 [Elusimicrobiota bacterium]
MIIDAKNKTQREINELLKKYLSSNARQVTIKNVNGERYLGAGLRGNIKIKIKGVAGNDLGSFMDGPEIDVKGNGQDCLGNTVNEGKIVVRGSCGDVLGYGMRGGRIYIQSDVGYRAGIHMKAYKDLLPVLIVGGTAQDYCGEYLAGGVIIVLGLNSKDKNAPVGRFVGTGMHGGTIYIKGNVEDWKLGKEVGRKEWNDNDDKIFQIYLKEYCKEFKIDYSKIKEQKFTKLAALSHRPYGKLYAY